MTEELMHGTVLEFAGPTDKSMAIQSLREELQAIDDYDERISASHCDSVKDALGHARKEEIEHAAMFIEWLRRNDAEFKAAMALWFRTDKGFGGE